MNHDLAQFMINNGPVAFSKFVKTPKPPQTLGAAIDLTSLPVSTTTGAIGGMYGLVATGASIGAAVFGKNRTKAIIRSIGCIGLTFVYMGAADL